MQKACGLLAEQFVSDRAPAQVLRAPRRTSNRGVVIAFGSFAAIAACVALVFFLGARRKVAPATPTDAVASSPAAPARGGVMLTSLSASDLRAPLTRDASIPMASSDSLEWVRSFHVNTSPALPEPTRFEPSPDLFRHELRAVPTSTPQAPAAESAAFRFQR